MNISTNPMTCTCKAQSCNCLAALAWLNEAINYDLDASGYAKAILSRLASLEAENKRLMLLGDLLHTRTVEYERELVDTRTERDALKAELAKIRPKADVYDRVCQMLGIPNDILGYVGKLKAELAEARKKLQWWEQTNADVNCVVAAQIERLVDYRAMPASTARKEGV